MSVTSPADASAAAPPVILRAPAESASLVVFASAHSGRDYPWQFVAESRLDPATLRRSEDSFVDELFAGAPALGAPLLHATFPRAWCDANRERWELDPAMFADRLPAYCNTASFRVQAGFGTLARIVADGAPIYRRKLRFAEAAERVRTCWEPYHAALASLVEATRARFGACLLIDCHSMPPERATGRRPADFVLGDAHGVSCAPPLVAHVENWLRGRGYAVERNDPYAGGFVTRHYGRPAAGIHVLQLEIARALYLERQAQQPGPGFPALREAMTALAAELIAVAPLLCTPTSG